MTTPIEQRTHQQAHPAAPFAPATAAKLVAAAIGTIYVVQIVLHAAGAPVLVGAIAGHAIVVTGLVALARTRGWRAADFGVRHTAPRFLVAAVLIGSSMWYVTLLLVTWVNPPGSARGLQEIVEQTPLVPTFIALTVFPALGEELVFRGVLTRALAPRFGEVRTILISAAVFALYHLMPAQMLSTFVLGLALAFLTLRARSIVPAFIIHFINNAIAIVLSRDELPAVSRWLTAHTHMTLVGAIACIGCGLALAAKVDA